jgi:hypothetical protein
VTIIELERICVKYGFICGVNSCNEVVIIEPMRQFPFPQHRLCRCDELGEVSELDLGMVILSIVFK